MTSGARQDNYALVCFALKEEARFLKPSTEWRTSVTVAITGIGKHNVARAIQRLVERSFPAFVLTCGFAGGLNPELRRGTIVFSVDDGFNLSPALLQLGAKPVCFHCSTRVAVTAAEKQQLRQSTQADAVDMESEIIREFCRQRGIPSATIRVISDAANEDLPLDFNALMTPELSLSYLKLAAKLVRCPAKISKLMELHKRTTEAARILGRCLDTILALPLTTGQRQVE